ncbi:cysteine desulfurase family protein [Sphingomonas sp. Leaf21]|uniref:cysteine desulfurase family protein n=1 Tax=Sphingomonas sp. Leaf21 TaxID=2876550 RepID=UPI001E5ACE06|nr:cysteine desulfurase family protein [Sphingomonas sp. Leaf21]
MAAPIYLDGFATLPLAAEARDAMLAVWEQPGNAGSPNASGERAARIIAEGRAEVAKLIGAAPGEIVFTSGATEANNLALLGVAPAAAALQPGRRRIVVSAIEHKAVLEPARLLERQGFAVSVAPVDGNGRLDLAALDALLGEDVLLASLMLVNNETGVVQPVVEAAALVHEAGGLVHSDAAQAAGKIAIDVFDLDIDYLSLSAHKCYGPMGIGALYVAAHALKPAPLIHGGGQQDGMRPGTEPVPLIAGFGAAAKAARERLEQDQIHGIRLVEMLIDGLVERQLRVRRITGDAPVVAGSAALQLSGIDANRLCAMAARQVSLSTSSACTSGQIKRSHVLEAIGFSEGEARQVIRIFCHRNQSHDDIIEAIDHIAAAAHRSCLAAGGVRQ